MAQKLTKEKLGIIYRKVTGQHSLEMAEVASENIGKPLQELLPLLAPIDQKIGVGIAAEVIRELSSMGVDFSSVWSILDKQGLVEWSKDRNGQI